MTAGWRALLVAALLLAGFALKGTLIAPPAASRSIAGGFDGARALARLERILGDQRPHAVDSPADDAVRERLMTELRAIGLQPRLQEATDCSATPKTRLVSCSHVRNVVATITSSHPGPKLLLNAHYDSTPTGPGAGDDGLGVAVLLEVGAALQASPPPRPVVLLFNEGEEFGLNGAHAFVAGDPLARQVNSLINIDVRGVSGPALMYETSNPNGAALGVYSAAAKRPYANSISTDFARLIPNTTDVVFFKPRGWTLLNYSIIGNETRYHSPRDNLAALSRDSVAHVGTEVLAATRAMAQQPDPARAGNARTVFTDLAGRAFIKLPLAVAAATLALLLAFAIVLAWRRKALGRPLALAAGMVAGGIAASAFASLILGLFRPGDFWRAYPLVAYLANYSVLLLAMVAIYRRFGRGIDRSRLRAACWLFILLSGSAASIALPGGTIFFLIAPAMAVTAIATSDRAPKIATALSIAAIFVQFVMFAELLALIEMLLIDGPLWAVAPLAAVAALPALIKVDAATARPAVIALALTSLALAVAALAMPRASTERPLGMSIDYYHETGATDGKWGIATKEAPLPGSFAGHWEAGQLPYNKRTRWIMRAPVFQSLAGDAIVIANEPVGRGRRVRLMLSPAGANSIAIRFPQDAEVLALGLPGAAIPIPAKGEPDRPLLRCTGRSCVGLEIEVLFANRKPVTAEIFATSFSLPAEDRRVISARPAYAQPQYSPDQSITRSLVKL